jgi:hypothetical protein
MTKKSLEESIKDLEALLVQQKKGGLKMMKAVRMTEMTLKVFKERLKKDKK